MTPGLAAGTVPASGPASRAMRSTARAMTTSTAIVAVAATAIAAAGGTDGSSNMATCAW